MYLRKVGTDIIFAPTAALMARTDMEQITDDLAKQTHVRLAKESQQKRNVFMEQQAELINSPVEPPPDEDSLVRHDEPMVQSLSDVKVDEPSYEADSDPLDALLEKHQ